MDFKFAKNVKILGLLLILVSVIFVFYASCSQRGLYSDGSFYFMQLLDNISKGNFSIVHNSDRARFFIQFLQSFPVLLTGNLFIINSKITLSTIYSFTLFAVPLLVLFWNYQLTKRTKEYGIFFWSVFTYCVLILLYEIYAVAETIIGLPLQFVLLNYLFGKINYTKWDKIGIAFILLMMFGIYEHTVFVGLIMFFATFVAAFDEQDEKNMFVKICIGGMSLAAACYSLFFMIVHNADYFVRTAFIEFISFWQQALNLNLVFAVVTVLLSAFILIRKKPLTLLHTSVISIGYFCIFWHMLNNLHQYINPVSEGYMQSIVFCAVPLIFLGILVYKIKARNKNIENINVIINNAFVPVILCGIFLTLWQIVNTYYWNQNIAYLKNEIQNCEDILYLPEEHEEISSFENKDLRRYIRHGNYVTTQIIFDNNYEIPTMLMHYEEPSSDGDNSYRSKMYYMPEKELINLPYDYPFSVQNSFWNLRNVAEALNEYNIKHNILIEKNVADSEEN